jgi:hypothetical protein
MTYKIVLVHEAKIDYKKSLLWYKDINPKLAIRFNESFKESLTIIKKNPLLFQTRYDKIRIKLLTTFPYAIHYSVYDNNIVIKSIYHTSRDGKLNIF